jgi:hypothetical protein
VQNVTCKTKATIIFYFKPKQRNINIYYSFLEPKNCKDRPFLVAQIIKAFTQKIFSFNIEKYLIVGNEYPIFINNITTDINPKI